MTAEATQPSGYTLEEGREAERLAVASTLGISEWPSFLSMARTNLARNVASPATEDRATARYTTRRDPSGSGLLLENGDIIAELETTDAAYAMALKLDAYTASQKRIEVLKAALTEISTKGCRIIHGSYPKGTTCIDTQEYARKNKAPHKFEAKFRAEILAGKHLCDRCVAAAALKEDK